MQSVQCSDSDQGPASQAPPLSACVTLVKSWTTQLPISNEDLDQLGCFQCESCVQFVTQDFSIGNNHSVAR